jgi:hypothetical protein
VEDEGLRGRSSSRAVQWFLHRLGVDARELMVRRALLRVVAHFFLSSWIGREAENKKIYKNLNLCARFYTAGGENAKFSFCYA